MKEKMTIILGIGIAVCVIVTLGFYLNTKQNIELFDIISICMIWRNHDMIRRMQCQFFCKIL